MYLRNSFLMALFWPFFATGESQVSVNNFNYVATISEGRQSLREFELPYEIFAGLQRKDYGDMRILNAQHQPLPFTVSKRRPPPKENQITHPLNFYRLAEAKSSNAVQLKLALENNSSISFSSTDLDWTAQNTLLIIKNVQQDYPLYKLKLQWTPQSSSFSIQARLESSADMQNWNPLRSKSVLYDLKHLNTSLLQNTILIPQGTKAKYLRLVFYDTSHFANNITQITGEYRQTIPVKNNRWKKLPALQQGNRTNVWLFNTHSLAAVTKIAFDIPQTGLFYKGTLYSNRPEKRADISFKHKDNYKREIKKILHKKRDKTRNGRTDWQYQSVVTQYRLISSSGEINSSPVSIHPTQDNEWKLVLNQPKTLLPGQIPEIKITWEPVIVTFLAQGKGPYKLYYGNPDALPQKGLLPNSPKNITVEKVTITDIKGNEKANISRQLKTYFALAQGTWQKALLWTLLCLGVLLMTFMVYRLFSNIASGKK